MEFKRVKDWYIYKPIEENANIIEVRTTMLETFYDCPYAYKFGDIKRAEIPKNTKDVYAQGKPVYSLWKTFQQGTVLHKATYNYIVAYNLCQKLKLDAEATQIFLHEEMLKIEKVILSHRELYDIESVIKSFRLFIKERSPLKELTYDPFVSELNMNIIFQFGDIGVVLTGTPDHLFYEKDGTPRFVDIKTTKSKRHPVGTEKWKKEYENRIQWRVYPLLTSFFTDFGNKQSYKFQYFPITKQVTPQVTHDFIIPGTTFQQAETFTLKLITKFVNAYRTQEYKTNPTTKRCFYCPLKKFHQCPHRSNPWF